MAEGPPGARVLRNKRDATQYQILVVVARRQPAVSQREIAEEVGITSQAVSDYLRSLIEAGHVEKGGRGRYEVTKEGVDWLISRTDALREFVDHVSEEVIDEVDVEAALATAPIEQGQTVALAMRDGALRATPTTPRDADPAADDADDDSEAAGDDADEDDGDPDPASETATAVAVTDAAAGEDVGVTDFEGLVDYELGTVTVVAVPGIRDGGSAAVPDAVVADRLDGHAMVAVAGTEAQALARRAGVDPDVRFGAAAAVPEAAARGLDVLALAAPGKRSAIAAELDDAGVPYEVVDPE